MIVSPIITAAWNVTDGFSIYLARVELSVDDECDVFGTAAQLLNETDMNVHVNCGKTETTGTYKYPVVKLNCKRSFTQHVEIIKNKAVLKSEHYPANSPVAMLSQR